MKGLMLHCACSLGLSFVFVPPDFLLIASVVGLEIQLKTRGFQGEAWQCQKAANSSKI